MAYKKVYIIGSVNGIEFAGHMEECDARFTFDSYRTVSKAEYRNARSAGMRSYGEHVTICKREGCTPVKRTRWAW